MDAVSDPDTETVVVMKSAQVGWTEILNNVVGFHIAQDPAPILIVQPTVEMGMAWSKDRLSTMLRDTPQIRGLVAAPRSRDGDNTLLHKTFPGGHLSIAGANSAASLASRPIRIVAFDEVDRYPPSAGSEGDPVTLGRKRTATFWNRKVLLGSTPTIAGRSRIEMAYEQSDQRRFYVPCPHCDEKQVLTWQQVRWQDNEPSTARYHCQHCGAAWSDAERWAAGRRGEWRASEPFTGTAGFHISELNSPWRRIAEMVVDFLAAKDRPEMLKAWVNTALGETWRERGDAPEWERLIERREDYPEAWAPRDALAVTAGVDVQGARLEMYVWAWGRGLTSWLVGREIFEGDPSQPAVWQAMRDRLDQPIRREGGGTLRIMRAAVDTGFSAATVYAQLRRLRDPRLLPIKGVDRWGSAAPVTGPTAVDVTESGRKVRGGLKIWTVAVSALKAELYRRLWLKREGDEFPAGWVHLPTWVDAEVVKQLVSEQLVTVKDRRGFSRQEWQKLRERNEALDCAVYARAALWVAGADRKGGRFWDEQEAALGAATLTAPAAEPQREMPPAEAVVAAQPALPAFRPRSWGGFGSAW
jgi:phage terminase large subunit GpA-like protein